MTFLSFEQQCDFWNLLSKGKNPYLNPEPPLGGGERTDDLRRCCQGGEELCEKEGESTMTALLKP